MLRVCHRRFFSFRCERQLSENDPQTPAFDGLAFVELMPLEKADHKVSVEMEFKTFSMNGVLMYAQQSADGLGDFISLAIIDG